MSDEFGKAENEAYDTGTGAVSPGDSGRRRRQTLSDERSSRSYELTKLARARNEWTRR